MVVNRPHPTTLSSSTQPSSISISSGSSVLLAPIPAYQQGPARFVLRINIVVYVLILCAVLWRLPRTITRLAKRYEWKDGFILGYQTPSTRKVYTEERGRSRTRRRTHASPRGGAGGEGGEVASDDSHLYLVNKLTTAGPGSSRRHRYVPLDLHPHIPSTLLQPLYPIAAALRVRIAPNLSFGQVFVVGVYFGVMAYAVLVGNNLFTEPQRAGYVAMAQIPLVFALAGKCNVIGALAAIGYEKLNFFHRNAGKILVLIIDIHAIGYFYQWHLAGQFALLSRLPDNIWGITAFAAANLLYISSLPCIRHRFHTLFLWTHWFAFGLFLLAASQHKPIIIPYVLAALALYILDCFILRPIRTRYTTATIRALPELGSTRIEIPSINKGWRAGQHVRIQVLSRGLGKFGWAEVHPFTIASTSVTTGAGVDRDREGEGLVLLVKKAGRWTEGLFDLARGGSNGSEKGEGGVLSREVKVLIEGPYGGPGCTVYTSFSSIVLVAGGSGISYALSIAQDVLARETRGHSRTKVLRLVWIVQDPISISPLLPTLTSLLHQALSNPQSLTLKINISYTGSSRSPPNKLTFIQSLPKACPSLTITPGRPDVFGIASEVLDETVRMKGPNSRKDEEANCGMVVVSCGPVGLGDTVVKEVGRIPWERRSKVGGVEVFDETFSL